ncbi:intradiol ring-cleavage dioxygenase [Massilia sp. DJPM01]|uniref:dioxygenase family protein n=1 Tax=Massilia sp. DJPM01 TaxID=3024404 RepID=UPI00259FB29E|nr:intradiol ring-cleavage dioxygenase [Massilia sp. DJPM01]MDM5177788.1 intradiol ring-cleavage dioxygenase [Massilia sp. DJPM01]
MEHHDHSLAQDMQTMLDMTISRRQSLRWMFASAAALPLAACGGGDDAEGSTVTTTAAADTGTTPATGSSASCAVIPDETGGPYPGDGTNSSVGGVANALILAGIVRPDIRASIAGASGVAAGVPLTIKLQMVNVKSSCASLAGATVYLWHCDREGRYSMYTSGVTAENYLRGVQEADASGMVIFTTIFPGCYAGRMPHVHFEVYPSLAKSTSAANRIKTSQFGFPTSMLADTYAATGYSASVRNLANISYATDNVFSDGSALQIASVSGSASLGYVATLTVGVSL